MNLPNLSNLSKREQTVGALTAMVLVLLMPSLVRQMTRDDLDQEQERKQKTYDDYHDTLAASATAGPRWEKMRAAGLTADSSISENQLFNVVRNAAQDTGVRLDSIKPDRIAVTFGINEQAFEATGGGTMRSLAQFLAQLESAQLPLRIREINITSRNETNDDLTFAVHVSTLWGDPTKPKPKAGAPASADEAGGKETP